VTRRVDLASGPVRIYGGARGCTIEANHPLFSCRDIGELNDLILALMEVREHLIEEPSSREGSA
jgi:hypothetical protein